MTETPLPRAGLPARLSSLVYECLLLLAPLAIAGLIAWLAGLLLFHDPGRLLSPQMAPLMKAWYAIVLGAYFVWFWTHGGQTLPMKTWRLRLVNKYQTPVALPQAVTRYITALGLMTTAMSLLALHYHQHTLHDRLMTGLLGALAPFLWAILDPQRLFLHDRLCGTRIVRLPRASTGRLGASQQQERRQGE